MPYKNNKFKRSVYANKYICKSVYVNRIENRIRFKIKTGCYPELLTPEVMKLLGRTKSKITKDKIGENVPHLESTEVVLVNYRVLYTFGSNKLFVNY